MRRFKVFFRSMMEAGNKNSSSRFFMLVCLFLSVIMYSIIAAIIAFDGFSDGQVDTDLDGLSSLMNAVGINLGIGGMTKVLSRDKVNRRNDDFDSQEDC